MVCEGRLKSHGTPLRFPAFEQPVAYGFKRDYRNPAALFK
jgi:hypothetical protein